MFIKFNILWFFENLLKKFKFHEDLTRKMGTSHDDKCTLFIISCSFLLRMRYVSEQVVKEVKTHFVFNKVFRTSYLLWDNAEKYSRAQQSRDDHIIWPMRFACGISKVTDTHSEYVILIAFPHQQCLQERAAVSRYKNISRLVNSISLNSCLNETCFR
jgi:hypothetical protein